MNESITLGKFHAPSYLLHTLLNSTNMAVISYVKIIQFVSYGVHLVLALHILSCKTGRRMPPQRSFWCFTGEREARGNKDKREIGEEKKENYKKEEIEK